MFSPAGRQAQKPLRWLDDLVQCRLQQWPNRPPGLAPDPRGDFWLRGRPGTSDNAYQPFLKLPGADRMRTLPDGLWLNFGGNAAEPYVDIFAIEACGSLQNLLDKRSRFAPSMHSLLAVCPAPWLLAESDAVSRIPRWRATGVIPREPMAPLIVPVRDMRVMYALKSSHYAAFAAGQLPHAHEFFVPMEALTAEHSEDNSALRALVARAAASASGNFLVETARPQPANGSRTRMVSSRSGLVDRIASGASVSSSIQRTYFTAAAGRSDQERAPRVEALQPSIDS